MPSKEYLIKTYGEEHGTRMSAVPVLLGNKKDSDKHEALVKKLRIPRKIANNWIRDFDYIQKCNLVGGEIISFSDTTLADIIKTRRMDDYKVKEFLDSVVWFGLDYMEHTLGTQKMDYVEQGYYHFGNTEKETEALLYWMKKNPLGLAVCVEKLLEINKNMDADTQEIIKAFKNFTDKRLIR